MVVIPWLWWSSHDYLLSFCGYLLSSCGYGGHPMAMSMVVDYRLHKSDLIFAEKKRDRQL